MSLPNLITWLFAIGMMAADIVCGQNYPHKPIRIVTSAAGGGNDIMARLIAQGITGPLGKPVIVDNRGGGGSIYGEIVARASPDGHTLLITGNSFWIGPLLQSRVPYDPVKDFSTITLAGSSPNVIVVHPSLPAKSVAELIALAKARAGTLNYSAGENGSGTHLAGELFKAMARVDIVRIPYKGTGPGINALIAGETQMMFPNAGAVTPHLISGRLRALAVCSTHPSPLAPGLPTVAASGLSGYEAVQVLGVWAPAPAPAPIVKRLHDEIARVLRASDAKEKLFNLGVEAVASPPHELAAFIRSDMTRMSKVIRDAGIRAE